MRLFVGVELPDAIKEEAAATISELRSRLLRVAPALEVRWVDPANLHITLVFIGEVKDENVTATREALTPPFSTAAFELHFAGLGAFPSTGAPRVFWVGTRSGAASLAALYEQVVARLLPLGYQPEGRPYSAHLTLGRVKESRRADSHAIRRSLEEPGADLGSCHVAAVTLFRSHLSPGGSTYEAVLRIPLR